MLCNGIWQPQRRQERQREVIQTELQESRRTVQEKTDVRTELTASVPNERQRTVETAVETAEIITDDTRIAPPVTPQPPRTQETLPDTRSDAQKHRDEVNAQIQRELKKQRNEKPVQRTRRRIG